MSEQPETETYTVADAERIEAALEELWARGTKTMLNIPVPATGEVRVVRWCGAVVGTVGTVSAWSGTARHGLARQVRSGLSWCGCLGEVSPGPVGHGRLGTATQPVTPEGRPTFDGTKDV